MIKKKKKALADSTEKETSMSLEKKIYWHN